MCALSNHPEGLRRTVRSVVLLGVLLGSVAVAWWLVRSRSGYQHRGADILAQIRSRGLDAFWKEEQAIEWFAIRSDKELIGWRAMARFRRPDKGFEGISIAFTPKGSIRSWEHWSLNADATENNYLAGPLLPGPAGLIPLPNTRIQLADGRILVQQRIKGRKYQSHVDVPDNYLPEGMLTLAASAVAREKTSATFQLVFNETPPRRQTTYLGLVEMEYAGQAASENNGGCRVTFRYSGRRELAFTYVLGADGRVLRVSHPKYDEAAVGQEEITKAFPNAPLHLKNLCKMRGMRLTEQVRKPREDTRSKNSLLNIL
ncbi:MAG: hypothetical protein SVT52_04435 [Planctomycetota bacterium]|nr:hypothetical protein [Planctomycetota bacterium]